MSRFWLRFGDREVAIPDGELIIGRGAECHVRLMAPSVSRRHLRLLAVGEAVVAFDLDSRNGSWIDGSRLTGPTELADGATIQVGSQSFQVRKAGDDAAWDEEPDTWDLVIDPPQAPAGRQRVQRSTVEIDSALLEASAAGGGQTVVSDAADLAVGRQACAVCGQSFDVGQPLCPFCGAEPYSAPTYRTCTGCKALLSEQDESCPKCGLPRPASSLDIAVFAKNRRDEVRHPTSIHGLYVSSALTFEAEVTNLSRGGLFIVAELLDPVGTLADIVLTTEGHGRARFSGEVAHVIDEPHPASGGVPGMGIRFVDMEPSARDWLDWFLANRGSIPPPV